jgi:hypothetical protein
MVRAGEPEKPILYTASRPDERAQLEALSACAMQCR